MSRFLKSIAGAVLITLGTTMMIFAWMFWLTDEEAMIVLASLYVAVAISAVIIIIGLAFLVKQKEE